MANQSTSQSSNGPEAPVDVQIALPSSMMGESPREDPTKSNGERRPRVVVRQETVELEASEGEEEDGPPIDEEYAQNILKEYPDDTDVGRSPLLHKVHNQSLSSTA